MSSEITCIENRVNICKEYTHLWHEFFNMFADGLNEKKITEEEETKFSRIMASLAFNHYKYSELMAEKFRKSNDILDVLANSVNLAHLKGLSEAQFSKLQIDWHTLFIEMNKCLGRLINDLSQEKVDELATNGRLALPSELKAKKNKKK